MRNQIIAQRYAKSLIDLAVEHNQLEEVLKDINFIRASVTKEFNSIMLSPVYSDGQKIKIFKAIFEGKISKLTYSFFTLVFHKGRELLFAEINLAFMEQYRKLKGIEVVELTTAVEISPELLGNIKTRFEALKRFEGMTIELVPRVKPEILGGFIAKFENLMFDASIRHDLHVIGKQFIENMYVQKMR